MIILYVSTMSIRRLFEKKSLYSGLLLAAIWFFLTGGEPASWLLGIPAIILGLLASTQVPKLPSFKLAIHHIPGFLLFFCYQSCRGGIDVALRTVTYNLSPNVMTFPFTISNQVGRIFFANIVSLLPGTLSADLKGDGVLIHLLDDRLDNENQLRKLEQKVAKLFCEEKSND